MICYTAKSYLPTHDTFHKTARYALHIFADAFHAGRVEAKSHKVFIVLEQSDAFHAGRVEAKQAVQLQADIL